MNSVTTIKGLKTLAAKRGFSLESLISNVPGNKLAERIAPNGKFLTDGVVSKLDEKAQKTVAAFIKMKAMQLEGIDLDPEAVKELSVDEQRQLLLNVELPTTAPVEATVAPVEAVTELEEAKAQVAKEELEAAVEHQAEPVEAVNDLDSEVPEEVLTNMLGLIYLDENNMFKVSALDIEVKVNLKKLTLKNVSENNILEVVAEQLQLSNFNVTVSKNGNKLGFKSKYELLTAALLMQASSLVGLDKALIRAFGEKPSAKIKKLVEKQAKKEEKKAANKKPKYDLVSGPDDY